MLSNPLFSLCIRMSVCSNIKHKGKGKCSWTEYWILLFQLQLSNLCLFKTVKETKLNNKKKFKVFPNLIPVLPPHANVLLSALYIF